MKPPLITCEWFLVRPGSLYWEVFEFGSSKRPYVWVYAHNWRELAVAYPRDYTEDPFRPVLDWIGFYTFWDENSRERVTQSGIFNSLKDAKAYGEDHMEANRNGTN